MVSRPERPKYGSQSGRRVPEDASVVFKFGGGLNTRASDDEIHEREAADGQNFVLDLENHELRGRNGFGSVGAAPNGEKVNGFAQLLKTDGTTSTLVQAGTVVYELTFSQATQSYSFSSVGAVAAGARLRGPLSANWQLDDKVLITDLAKAQPVMEWDGADFKKITHNLAGDFFAKYAAVAFERAYFGNVQSGTDTPHVLVGSKVSDFTNLSVSNKPSSALGADDPFFIPTPDLRPINGLLAAFGRTILSTSKGAIWHISGQTAQNFLMEDLFTGSGADGDESLTYVGNDIAYGRQGRLETLTGVINFGDVETDDLSRHVAPTIQSVKTWTAAYNSRLQRIYFFPAGGGEIWLHHKAFRDAQAQVSPWSRWTTDHVSNFDQTAAMTLFDPADGLERVFWGDTRGNVFKMEGSGFADPSSTSVTIERLSQVITLPDDAEGMDIEGYIKYRRAAWPVTLTLTLEYGGETAFDDSITITIPAPVGASYYSGSSHYSAAGDHYGAPFEGRILRQRFKFAGQSNEAQVRVSITTTRETRINEIGLKLRAAA